MVRHSVRCVFAGMVALLICALPAPYGHAVLPKIFIVFFEFGSVELDDNARSVLVEYAQVEREMGLGDATVTLIGHTDSIESASLSEQRAQAVRSALIQLGVDGNRISTTAKGASDPIPGGSDAQNRRVQIDYHFPVPR